MTRSFGIFAALAALAIGCSNRLPVQAGPSDRVAYAIDLGHASPDAHLDFVLGLRAPSKPLINKFLDEQRFSNDVLSPEDFGDKFGVPAGEYARIVTWLQSHGLTVSRTVPGRLSISGSGIVANIEDAFGVTLHEYQDLDGKFIAAVEDLQLSPEIASSVSGIVGIEGARPWLSHMVKMPTPSPFAVATYTAAKLETQYNSTGITTPGMGETIVILGAGNQPKMTDVTAYVTGQNPYGAGLTALPSYTQEQVGGPNRDPMASAENERGENTLDIDMVAAMAPYATIYQVMTATNGVGLFADGISYIVNKHASAHAVTVSYGTCERGAAGEMTVMNSMFMQAKAEGQQWFFAAGDSGTDGCRDGIGNKIISAGWPASSPYVVGVGGTSVLAGTTEVVWDWNDPSFHGATGGGASESLDKPAFQMGVTPADNARDEPDVAALGGNPGVIVIEDGAQSPTGGTSAATPMWAGVWALLEQGKGHKTITNGLEELYTLGKAGTGFHDITSGNNGSPGDGATGGYAAGTGYDLSTGWGSPNVTALIANWP